MPITSLPGTLVSSPAKWAPKRARLLGPSQGSRDPVPDTVLHVENGSSHYEPFKCMTGLFNVLAALDVHTFPAFLAQDSFQQKVLVIEQNPNKEKICL